jgi:hypothetical protein
MKPQQIESLRRIDLTQILPRCGCSIHRLDKCKWHTPCGTISVNGQKFMNWSKNKGGGGAIDLVCHLRGDDFKQAVAWLASNFDPSAMPCATHDSPSLPAKTPLRLPPEDRNKTERIIHYLTHCRRIPRHIVMATIQYRNLYADSKANAVFLLLGKEKKVVGAELRGTGPVQWRGMAPGSKKGLGCFYALGESNRKMLLCESAIDALSCLALWPEYTAISTSGATHNPAWLKKFLDHGCKIYCGFDADRTGDIMADKMIKLYPSIKRLRPSMNDWNEQLQASYPS